jgi:hypothetical protein
MGFRQAHVATRPSATPTDGLLVGAFKISPTGSSRLRLRAKRAQLQEGPQSAWIELQSLSVSFTDPCGNQLSFSASLSRLADIDAEGDWYLVTTTPQTIPNNAAGFETIQRGMLIQPVVFPGLELTEHQPTGTITTSSVSVMIGVSLSAGTNFSVGFSASVTFSWQQPSVLTTDQTIDAFPRWNEGLESGTSTSQGTFFSIQSAIFKVPEGTQSFFIIPQFTGTWSMGCSGNPQGITIDTTATVNPLVFTVSTDTVQIAPGGQGEVTLTAEIPNSPQGLPWTLSAPDQPPWLTFSQASGSTSATIQLAVAPDAPVGSTAFLNFQTDLPFGAPSVEQNPPIIKVEVVAP